MKLIDQRSKYESNTNDEDSLEFGIGDVSVIIDILRNKMYENKVRTICQEYIANAIDANREAGQSRKIEIKVPSKLDPEFKIRDFGPGVTKDRMANVFVKYGSSTKRSTNGLVGGFGLGAKSAWAYTDSFGIVTYVDGVKCSYVAEVASSKNGKLSLLSEEATTEPNGTEISIQVKQQNIQEFINSIERATMFCKESEYPIFSNIDTKLFEQQREIGKKRFSGSNLSGLSFKYGIQDVTIIIDCVPYPLPQGFTIPEVRELQQKTGSTRLNVFVPNGLVQVAASREKIDDSEMSKKALKQIFVAALADFERAKKKWEDKIVDTASMLKAIDEQHGFSLSTDKSFDFISLKRGQVYFETERKIVNKPDDWKPGEPYESYDEKLFSTYGLTSNKRVRATFNVLGENRYYLPKQGSRSIVDITDWIACTSGINNINLITVLAQREETVEKDGEDIVVLKRDKDLANELIELVERLGFKNIEDVVQKVKKVKTSRKSGVAYEIRGTYENQIDISDLDEDESDEDDETDKKSAKKTVNVNETWVYFIGRKGDYHYNSFINFTSKMKEFKEIDRVFRFLEKDRKKIEADPRFIDWNEFRNKWVPGNQLIFNYTIYEANAKSVAYDNIIKNYANHNDVIYKACKKLSSRPRIHMDYTIREQIIKTKLYKELISSISTLDKFLDENLPFLSLQGRTSKHCQDYIIWALDKAAKDGKMLVLPNILLN